MGGWGAWAAHAPSLGTEQLRMQRFTMRLAPVATRHSPHLDKNHCFMFCKRKALKSAAPRDIPMAVFQIQRLIPKGRGSEKRPYDESPELNFCSGHKSCVVMVVFDGPFM